MPTPNYFPVDTYIKYFDFQTRSHKFMYLIERRAPIRFPFRFTALAPGSESSNPVTFDNLRPDTDEDHIYQAFLGLYPDTDYKVWHPFNVRQNQLDERIDQLADEDLAQVLKYDDSPHDAPVFSLWLDEQRYPGITPRNVGSKIFTPQIDWSIAKYRVLQDDDLDPTTKSDLEKDVLHAIPIDFGGEI